MTNTKHSERSSQQFWEEMDKEYEKLKEEIWQALQQQAAEAEAWLDEMEKNIAGTRAAYYERIMNNIDKECDD